MGVLDFLRAAIEPAAAARVGYHQGQERELDKRRQLALQDQALQRQSLLDQITAELHKSQIDENAARARNYDRGATEDSVQWVVDDTGNRVPLPKKLPRGDGGPTVSSSPSNGAPSSPLATVKSAIGATAMPSDSQDMTGSSDAASSPLATVKNAVSSQEPQFKMGQPSGVKAPPPKQAAPPRIDPNSPAGISADSAKFAKRRTIQVKNPLPSRAAGGAGGAGGAGSTMEEIRKERLFNTVAQNAINAAELQIPPDVTGDDRRKMREQLAMQSILGNAETKDIFSQGMSSRHIQAASQQFERVHTKDVDAHGRSQNLYGDGNTNAPPAKGGGKSVPPPRAPTGPVGDVDLRTPDSRESSLSDADLWEKKVGEGMSKEKATAYVKNRKKP